MVPAKDFARSVKSLRSQANACDWFYEGWLDTAIEVSLTTLGGGTGSTTYMHISAGDNYYWNRNGNRQTFRVKVAGLSYTFESKIPGKYHFKRRWIFTSVIGL
jgi:hypothetical protein